MALIAETMCGPSCDCFHPLGSLGCDIGHFDF